MYNVEESVEGAIVVLKGDFTVDDSIVNMIWELGLIMRLSRNMEWGA